ncbi:alpha/beta hydrolase [Gracilibacillus sp. YIM 98692]|uniref:alpha/beta fold hydrolase n=1 Tax=Gracilibacillus sp. YIM 98692 TaxID=2663532 RepID=UPI0013D06A39|nr:alpha/beta hydrolase [Gracilibacillus sp. YIM 98692]
MQKTIPFKGHTICYEIYSPTTQNNNPFSIVMLHGFLASRYCFRHLIHLLKEECQIVTLDIPPFGDSTKNKQCTYTFDHIAKSVIFLMEQLNIDKAHILGHSMGGQIALRCAYYYPERVHSLTVLSPCSFMNQSQIFAKSVSLNPFAPFFIRKLLKRKGVYEMLRHSMYDDDLITEEMLEHYKKPFVHNKMIYPCLVNILKDHQKDLDEDELQKLTTSCTIFWGKEDLILPYLLGYELLKFLPNANLILLNQTGHLIPEESPKLVASHLLRVISKSGA